MTQPVHTPGPCALVLKDDKYGKELLIVQDTEEDDCAVICGAFSDENDARLLAAAYNASTPQPPNSKSTPSSAPSAWLTAALQSLSKRWITFSRRPWTWTSNTA
jgi:hypothetical protein